MVLIGTGRAGLWTMLAAPGADAIVADADGWQDTGDDTWLAPDLFVPGIRNLGGLDGVLALAAPHPILVHNTGAGFTAEVTRTAYAKSGEKNKSRLEKKIVPENELVRWIAGL